MIFRSRTELTKSLSIISVGFILMPSILTISSITFYMMSSLRLLQLRFKAGIALANSVCASSVINLLFSINKFCLFLNHSFNFSFVGAYLFDVFKPHVSDLNLNVTHVFEVKSPFPLKSVVFVVGVCDEDGIIFFLSDIKTSSLIDYMSLFL